MTDDAREMKKITLIIATFNGSRTLPCTLASIKSLTVSSRFELNLIIIDNNSSDSTRSILERFEPPFPILKLEQKRSGKNAALNTIFEYQNYLGDLLVFSDDDVLFPRDFIERYDRLSERFEDVHIFGGAIEPLFLATPPQNLLDGIDSVVAYAITPKSSGYHTGNIQPVKIHGPNLALRKEVFDNGIRFNEGIGPNGENYMMGSETELLYRLTERGYKAYFDSENVVKHIVRPEQIRLKWLSGRAYKAGRSFLMHQIKQKQDTPVAMFFGYPRWAFFKMWMIRLKNVFVLDNSAKYYQGVWEANHLRGYCDEYRRFFKNNNLRSN